MYTWLLRVETTLGFEHNRFAVERFKSGTAEVNLLLLGKLYFTNHLIIRRRIMTPGILRLFGILFLVGAVTVSILNLHRVANLGLPWVAPLLLVVGAALMGVSKRMAR